MGRRRPSKGRGRGRSALAVLAAGVFLAVTVTACSSDGEDSGSDEGGSSSETTDSETTEPRPEGPVATIGGPMSGGEGINLATSDAEKVAATLDAAGYTDTEYTATGTATSYTSEGDLPPEGTFELEEGETADYVTRIVVRRPEDPEKFNGVVAVEWLNVSGGLDTGAFYTYLETELLREGYAWVGVSTQRIGIEGGPVLVEAPGAEEAGAGKGLRTIDPERYGDLHHPGDAFSYDMYTQAARALREPGDIDPLDGLDVKTLLAVGESQSAVLLSTYFNGVQPLTRAFDGFFIHSRAAAPAPLEAPSGYIDLGGSLGGQPTKLRTDGPAPVINIQAETDVLGIFGSYRVRQPDTEHTRTWEVAGNAHADLVQIGEEREASLGCETPINRGQQMFVLRAALRHLTRWVDGGEAPPHGEPIALDTSPDTPTFVRDDVGNVKGGVRTPVVDAPVDVLTGIAPGSPSVLCLLLGATLPIPADQLATLYDSGDDYMEQYEAATDAGIEAGFLLDDDRDEILEGADPSRITG